METKTTKVKCCKETIYGLTFGKIYDVIEEDFIFFKIIDDNGKSIRITKDNFWDASNEMEATKNYQGQELRNSTTSEYVIFFEGKELKTSKSGAINSNNGIVLTAQLPTGEWIKWRSNDNYGKKGFSFDGEIRAAKDDSRVNAISSELRSKLEYKLVNK